MILCAFFFYFPSVSLFPQNSQPAAKQKQKTANRSLAGYLIVGHSTNAENETCYRRRPTNQAVLSVDSTAVIGHGERIVFYYLQASTLYNKAKKKDYDSQSHNNLLLILYTTPSSYDSTVSRLLSTQWEVKRITRTMHYNRQHTSHHSSHQKHQLGNPTTVLAGGALLVLLLFPLPSLPVPLPKARLVRGRSVADMAVAPRIWGVEPVVEGHVPVFRGYRGHLADGYGQASTSMGRSRQQEKGRSLILVGRGEEGGWGGGYL